MSDAKAVYGYREALERAGVEVLAFIETGDWQGRWWAKISHNGKVGWITDYYGSCSCCDILQSIENWDTSQEEYDNKIKDLVNGYLDNFLTQKEVEKEASKDADWDLDAANALEFIKTNR